VSGDAIRGKRILVVEDEPLIQGLLSDMLSADGHEVDVVGTGVAALEKIAERSYDLVISDLRMPELDGPGLYRVIESKHKALLPRVIFVTGSALEPSNEQFLEETHVPWLSKPFKMSDLHQLTQRVLRGL
jgi:CheY-like chemotaxis protein